MAGVKGINAIGVIKAHFKRIVILLIIVVSLMFTIMYISDTDASKDGNVSDIVGSQRFTSQKIARDCNRAIGILSYDEDDYSNLSAIDRERIRVTLDSIQKELKKDINSYEKVHKEIKSGKLSSGGNEFFIIDAYPTIRNEVNRIDAIWSKMEVSAMVVANAKSLGNKEIESINYINDNSDLLLELNNSIIKNILGFYEKKYKVISVVSGMLFAISSALIVYVAFNMYEEMVIPFKLIYDGLRRIGLGDECLGDEDGTVPEGRDIVSPLVREIETSFLKMDSLIELIENMNKNQSLFEMIRYIFDSFSRYIPYTYIGIAVIDFENKHIEAKYGVSRDENKTLIKELVGKRYNLDETSLASILVDNKVRIINDYSEYVKNKTVREYTKIIMDSGLKSSISLPIFIGEKPYGIIFFSSDKANVYDERHVRFLKAITNSLAINIDRQVFVGELIYGSMLGLAKLAEARDETTGDHLERMKLYAKNLAWSIWKSGTHEDEVDFLYIEKIERYSPLHDIGKVAIDDNILRKPGKLTYEEFETMKLHTVHGAEVMASAGENLRKLGKDVFEMGIEIARHHHEKWDGSGYPHGLSGLDIPLSARIVAIADVFDALTSERPYKKAFSFDESVNIIKEGSGSHFDPALVELFIKNLDSFKEILMFGKCTEVDDDMQRI